MKPNILNPKWVYVPSHETCVAKTIKKEQARLCKIAADKALANQTVVAIKRVGK